MKSKENLLNEFEEMMRKCSNYENVPHGLINVLKELMFKTYKLGLLSGIKASSINNEKMIKLIKERYQ